LIAVVVVRTDGMNSKETVFFLLRNLLNVKRILT